MTSEKKRFKMAIIAGASHAMKYKDKNPRANSDEVIKQVAKDSEKILANIDKEE